MIKFKRVGSAGRARTVNPAHVWDLKAEGFNHRQIAQILKCSYSAVGRVVWAKVNKPLEQLHAKN